MFRKKIIISLTSYPARINTVNQTIESLLKQTIKADKIILWLSKKQFPNKIDSLPNELKKLIGNGLSIGWYSQKEDIKPYNKIINTLKKYRNSIIITVDDDIIYPADCVEGLYKKWLQYPQDVICNRAHKLKFDDNGIIPYNNWELCTKTVGPSYHLLQTGVGAVLYPPKCFYKDVLKEKLFMTLSRGTDDLWLWAMLVLKGTKIRRVDKLWRDMGIKVIDNTQDVGLWNTANSIGGNDKNLKLIFAHYPKILKRLEQERLNTSEENFPLFYVSNDKRNTHTIINISALKIKFKKDFLQQIFSIKNSGVHKVITILGIKIKLCNKNIIFCQINDSLTNLSKQQTANFENCLEQSKQLIHALNSIAPTINQGLDNYASASVKQTEQIVATLSSIAPAINQELGNCTSASMTQTEQLIATLSSIAPAINQELGNCTSASMTQTEQIVATLSSIAPAINQELGNYTSASATRTEQIVSTLNSIMPAINQGLDNCTSASVEQTTQLKTTLSSIAAILDQNLDNSNAIEQIEQLVDQLKQLTDQLEQHTGNFEQFMGKFEQLTNQFEQIPEMSRNIRRLYETDIANRNAALIKDNKFPIVNSLVYVPDYPLDYIQRTIVNTGDFYEIKDLKFLNRYLDCDSIVLDIGANIGNHTVYWGKRKCVKKVYSFEPIKLTYDKLLKNVEINSLQDVVETYNVGISDIISKGKINILDTANFGGSSIVESESGDIDIITIDSLNINEPITLMKIDTEGFEHKVLLGAINTIKKYKPYIYIEISENLELIEAFLEGLGYDKGECICKINYFFKPL